MRINTLFKSVIFIAFFAAFITSLSGCYIQPGPSGGSSSSNSSSSSSSAAAYTVIYDPDGATGNTPADNNLYTNGQQVIVLSCGNLINIGYIFAGWTNSSGRNYSSGSTFIMDGGDVTLYAVWTQNPTYTVTYIANGATGGNVPVDNNSYLPGSMVTVQNNTGNLVKTGYNLAGWTNNVSGGFTSGSTFEMMNWNITLYAVWAPTYTVTYSSNGSTGGTVPIDTNLYTNGQTVTVLSNSGNLVQTSFVFLKWNTQTNGSGTSYSAGNIFPMGPGNITLYAIWNPLYTVTYSGNGSTGGTAPSDLNNYTNGQTVTVLGNTGNLVQTGFVFLKWNTQTNGSGTSYSAGNIFPMGPGNITLYAIWNPLYTVTYIGNGCTGGSVPVDVNNYTNGQTVTVLSNTGNLVQSNFVFLKWNTQANGSGISYSVGNTFTMGSSGIILYVDWAPVCTVTFNNQGGTPATETTNAVSNTALLSLPSSPTYTGYSFGGWFTATNGGGTLFTSGTIIISNITVYAYWESGSATNYTSPNIGILKYVPSGSFQRDSTNTNISVISALHVSEYDITRAQWIAVTGLSDPSAAGNSANCPVDTVTWYQVIYFCNILSMKEGLTPAYTLNGSTNPTNWLSSSGGLIPTSDNSTWDAVTVNMAAGYRLPTEMEYMWASMGADSANPGQENTNGYLMPFAGAASVNQANINAYAWTQQNDNTNSEPVGLLLPNQLGLYDLSGNLWEWCWDWYASYPSGTLTNYQGASSGNGRCIRDGSWIDLIVYDKIGYRYNYNQFQSYFGFGFRVVRP